MPTAAAIHRACRRLFLIVVIAVWSCPKTVHAFLLRGSSSELLQGRFRIHNSNTHVPTTITHSRLPLVLLHSSSPFAGKNNINNDDETLLLSLIRQGVSDAGHLDAWDACASYLSTILLSLSHTDCQLILGQALGWKSWAKASESLRKYQQPKVPQLEKLQQAIEWLQKDPLQLSHQELVEYSQNHAAIYLLDPAALYKKSLSSAPRQYRDAALYKELIRKDPTLLQVTYNCDGDDGCASNCGSCWVTYSKRL